jgi:RNA polymerase sigma-70 factor (ECF subfamily)
VNAKFSMPIQSHEMPDAIKSLIKKAKKGDKKSFGKLVKIHQRSILYLAYDLVGNYEDAKDLAQDVFIRAFEKLNQFEERSQFSTWLNRITVNLAIDFHRKNKKKLNQTIEDNFDEVPHNEILAGFDHQDSPEEAIELSEDRTVLEQAITKLSTNQRTAIALKYFHQNSTKEIAEIMGCAENTVRIHLFRAMGNLKKLLQEYQNS